MIIFKLIRTILLLPIVLFLFIALCVFSLMSFSFELIADGFIQTTTKKWVKEDAKKIFSLIVNIWR